MITFQVDGTNKKRLWASVDTGPPLKEKVWLYRDCASEIEAALLEQQIDRALQETMKSVRQVSYLAGWRDAKSKKRAKRSWFARCLSILDWEKKEAGL